MSQQLELDHDEAAEIAEYLVGRDCTLSEAIGHYFGTSAPLSPDSYNAIHAEVFQCTDCQTWCSTEDSQSEQPGICTDCTE